MSVATCYIYVHMNQQIYPIPDRDQISCCVCEQPNKQVFIERTSQSHLIPHNIVLCFQSSLNPNWCLQAGRSFINTVRGTSFLLLTEAIIPSKRVAWRTFRAVICLRIFLFFNLYTRWYSISQRNCDFRNRNCFAM